MNGKNLFSIGEVAKALGITRRIILNYEAKGIISPDKKDGETGNRYYTVDTFTRIRAVRAFQNFGLSLDEVREYFNDNSDLMSVIKRLETMREELDLTIEKLRERTHKENDEIKEITIEPQTVYCRIYNSKSVADKTNLLRDTAIEALRKHGTDIARRMFFTEYSADEPEEVSYCVAVPAESEGEHIKHLPELAAISFFHHGAYEDIPDVRKRLIVYAEEKGIKLTGVFRNLYLEGPPQHKDKRKFITQIIAMVE
ncbi:MAG: MerR family transcriptional regulator [Oscillospiraceae bacterium]|nr:MerR family transcriptional regulator [Oscillospiraceae bacterium]